MLARGGWLGEGARQRGRAGDAAGGWDEAYLLQLGAALGNPTAPAKTRRCGARRAETPLEGGVRGAGKQEIMSASSWAQL